MNHIVNTCPLTKFEGGLNLLHEANDDAVIWLESTVPAALTKKIIVEIGERMSVCGRADPEKIQKLMPAPANPSMRSLQLLQSGPDGASVSSLPISESEDETQGVYCFKPLSAHRMGVGGIVFSACPSLCACMRAYIRVCVAGMPADGFYDWLAVEFSSLLAIVTADSVAAE